MEIKKRKREDQEDIETVLTFHAAGGRTFDRLFKDKDLQHLKAGLKKKLQVPEQTEIRLTQLRDGRKVDLDDDEDFDAMRARSHSTSSINILVAIGNSDFGSPNQGSQPVSSAESLPPPKKKKRKSKAQQSTEDGPGPAKSSAVSRVDAQPTGSQSSKTKRSAEHDKAAQEKDKTKRVSLVEPSSTSTQLPVSPNNKPAQAVKATATRSSSILKVSKPPAGVNGRSPGTSTNTKQVNSALSNVTQHVTFSPIVSVLTGDTQRPIASTSKEATSQPKASSSKPAETPTSLDAGKTPSKPEKKRKRSSIDESGPSKKSTQPAETRTGAPQPPGTSKPRHQGEEPEPSSSTQIPTPKAVSPSLEPSSEPKKKKSKSKPSGTVVEPPQPVSVPPIVPSTSTLSTSTPNKVSNQPDKSLDTNEPGSGRRNKKVNKEKVKQLKDLLRAGALSKGRVASTAPSADENPKDGTSQPNPAEGEKQRDEAPGPKEVPPIPPSDTPLEAVETLKRVTKAQEDIVRNAVYAVLNKRFPDCVLPALPVNASRSTIGAESSTSTSVPPLTQSSHLKPAPSAPATIDVFGSSVTPAKVPAAKGSKSSNQKPTPSSSKKTQGDPCPVCDAPFHLRHLCPIVKAGPDSLEKRIGELKANGADEELIKDLRTSVVRLRAKDARAEKSSESSTPSRPAPSDSSHVAARQPVTASLAVPTASGPEGSVSISTSRVGSQKNKPDALPPLVVERIISQSVIDVPSPLSTPLSARPIIPAGSVISEVTVESHGEGSSDEDESDSEDEAPLAAAVKLGRSAGSKGPKGSKPLDTTDLEAVLHGPPRSSQAILAAIVSDSEEDKDENKYLDSDEEDAELEEQKTDKAFRRLSKHFQKEDSPSDDDDAPLVPPTVMDADPKAPKKGQPPRSRLSSTSSSERAVEDTVGRAESAESEVPETTPSEPSPPVDNRELSLEIPPPTSTAPLVGSSDPIEADSPVRPQPVLSSQENPDDPIEPADEFSPNKKSAPVLDADADLDSIEVDDEEINPEAIITPPPLSPIKPGTAKRMKDRRGKALNDDPEHLIVPAKVVAESTPAAVPRVTRKRGASVSQPPPTPKPLASKSPTREPASQPLVTKKPSSGVRARPPRSVPAPATAPDLAAASSTASTSTAVPAPTTDAPAEAKRRGRPRIAPEERARRETERIAQREQKAAERAAAKEAKDAAKLALKQQKQATSARSRRASAQKKPDLPPESEDEGAPLTATQKPSVVEYIDKVPAPSGEPPLPQAGDSQVSELSVAQWTTLGRSSPETEQSQVDQLFPSSPSSRPEPASPSVPSQVTPLATPATSQQKQKVAETNGHLPHSTPNPNALQTPANKKNKMDVSSLLTSSPPPTIRRREDQTPLFLPGTQYAEDMSMELPSQGDHSMLDDEEEEAPTPSQQSQRSRMPPPRPSLVKPTGWGAINPKWRRLSDISSQQLFPSSPATPMLTPIVRGNPNVLKAKRGLLNGGRYDESSDDDDDDEDSSSSSDEEEDADKSHIPKNRRAGMGTRKPKKGLLDYA